MKNLLIFFILPSCVFAQSNIDEDTVHFIGQASAFTVGANLVTNGNFAADSGWTKGTGWTTAGGDADCDGSAGGDTELLSDSAITTVTGTVYRVQFEVTVFTGGNVVAVFDGVEVGGDKAAVGVYTTYVAATDASSTIALIGDSSFIGSCDNVSVVTWVGDLEAGGGCTIATFTGTLTDYMTATGGVLFEDTALATDDNGSGLVEISAATIWGVTLQVGGFVNVDLSAPLENGGDDGIYVITAVTVDTIVIDVDFADPADNDITVNIWIGGAYPDIATAINDSTLSEDPDLKYRKRYICVNVPMEVDAVTDFVAESSETVLREDDGSRKLIGFYDSIEVVTAHSSYRVVSDMDEGGIYYAGAWQAFKSANSFPDVRPNGKWIEWNAKGNAINILELNTSNVELRNLKIHNTVTGGSEGLIHIGTANFNTTFTNCIFDTSSMWVFDDLVATQNTVTDCYFGDGLEAVDGVDFKYSTYRNCIIDGPSRSTNVTAGTGSFMDSCLVYGASATGLIPSTYMTMSNCIVWGPTTTCVKINLATRLMSNFHNNIFLPAAASDMAFQITVGTLGPASFNNIFWTVAGVPMTNPITHDQISPNPPLPVGTIEKDPLFVNSGDGDFRRRVVNDGMRSLFDGYTTAGTNQPYSSPNAGYRSRYNFKGHNYSDR